MKRRLLIGAVAVVLLLLLAGAGAVYWFLSGDGVRLALERQASAWLGEPVRIGRASARFFPRIGIQLSDVTIGDPARLTLAQADVSTELGALLNRRIENADVVISDSRIELPLPAAAAPDVSENGPADGSGGAGAIELVSVRTIALRDIRVVSRGRELLVSADSSLDGTTLTIGSFTAQSGQTELEAEGVAELEPRLDAKLRVTANRLDVDELMALAEAFTPEPAPAGRTAAAGTGGSAAGLPGRIAARVSAETATAAGLEVQQFSTDFEMDGNDVALSPVTFLLFGGKYQGSLDARLGEAMTATLNSRIMDIDVAQLAAWGGVPDTVTGTLTAAADFSGQGTDIASALAAARGKGTVQIVDGTIRGLNLVRTVVLFFGRPAPDTAEATDRFDRFDATWSLANQIFRADALSLRTPDADIVGTGTLHIPTQKLDGELTMSLSEELSAQAGTDFARFTREGKRIVLPARIGGTLESPRLTIDAAKAVERGLRNEVERRLKGLLGGFGREQ